MKDNGVKYYKTTEHAVSHTTTRMEVALWIVLLSLASGVGAMLCCVTCCAIRCFRPQNSAGAEWFADKDGKERLVKGVFERTGTRGWLKAKAAAAPVIRPASTVPLPATS